MSRPSCLLAALPTLLTCLLLHAHRAGHAGHRGRRDTGDGAAVVKPNVHRMESMVLPYPDTRPRAAQGSVPEATAKPLVAPGHPENLADHRDKAGSQLPEPGGREGTQGPSTARKAGLGGCSEARAQLPLQRPAARPPVSFGSRPGLPAPGGGSCRPENTALLAEAAKYATVHPA